MPPRSSPPPGRQAAPPPRPGHARCSWIWLVLLAVVFGLIFLPSLRQPAEVDYSEFLKLINNDKD